MPYLSVQSAAPIDGATATRLQQELGALISILPGKNIDNCLIQLRGGCATFIGGAPVDAVYVEIHLFGVSPSDKKAELCEKINALLTRELGAKKVTLNIFELSEWGAGPVYRS